MRLKTTTDCRRGLQKIVNGVIDGTLDPKVANTGIYGINSILGAIRNSELEERIKALEDTLEGGRNGIR